MSSVSCAHLYKRVPTCAVTRACAEGSLATSHMVDRFGGHEQKSVRGRELVVSRGASFVILDVRFMIVQSSSLFGNFIIPITREKKKHDSQRSLRIILKLLISHFAYINHM